MKKALGPHRDRAVAPVPMLIRCSYCRKLVGEKEPLADSTITHGICADCLAYYEPQWSGQNLDEYLDRFDFPVLAVNEHGRVVGANRRVCSMLGKEARALRGLLGGEATDCVYARLPEGCEQTVHCQRCTIRRTVTETFATGVNRVRVPASLDQGHRRTHFLISTFLEGETVHLVIETVLGSEPRLPDTSLQPRSPPRS